MQFETQLVFKLFCGCRCTLRTCETEDVNAPKMLSQDSSNGTLKMLSHDSSVGTLKMLSHYSNVGTLNYPRTQVLGPLKCYPTTQVLGPLKSYPTTQMLVPLKCYPRTAARTLLSSSNTVARVFGHFIHYPSTSSGTCVKNFPVQQIECWDDLCTIPVPPLELV